MYAALVFSLWYRDNNKSRQKHKEIQIEKRSLTLKCSNIFTPGHVSSIFSIHRFIQ